jgi:hypothetical protein
MIGLEEVLWIWFTVFKRTNIQVNSNCIKEGYEITSHQAPIAKIAMNIKQIEYTLKGLKHVPALYNYAENKQTNKTTQNTPSANTTASTRCLETFTALEHFALQGGNVLGEDVVEVCLVLPVVVGVEVVTTTVDSVDVCGGPGGPADDVVLEVVVGELEGAAELGGAGAELGG